MRKVKVGWLGALMLLTVAVAPLSAQAAVGVRAGVRRAGLEAAGSTGSLAGVVVGGYFGVGLSDHVALQLEAVYGTRGSTSVHLGTGQLDPAASASELRMRYLDVPVLLRTGFPGRRLMPSFFAGPYAGFLLGCEITPATGSARNCSAGAPGSDGGGATFSPRATDFGMVVGGALDVLMGENSVYLDARYTLGILSIQSGDNPMDARHNGLEISAGFAFPLGR